MESVIDVARLSENRGPESVDPCGEQGECVYQGATHGGIGAPQGRSDLKLGPHLSTRPECDGEESGELAAVLSLVTFRNVRWDRNGSASQLVTERASPPEATALREATDLNGEGAPSLPNLQILEPVHPPQYRPDRNASSPR